MTRKHLLTLGMAILMLVAFVGTAAAQAVEPPTATPTPTTAPVQPTSKFFSHPVVQILSAYFSQVLQQPTAVPTTDPSATPDPNATPVPTVDPQEQTAQQIATYHEEGMGFGVLVKLYAMAAAAQEACPITPTTPTDPAAQPTDPAAQPACTAVTIDELVTSFRSGTGMGALFKEYGKPALLGVGHVRKALSALNQQPATGETTPVVTFGKGHKPVKGPNGQGNGKNK